MDGGVFTTVTLPSVPGFCLKAFAMIIPCKLLPSDPLWGHHILRLPLNPVAPHHITLLTLLDRVITIQTCPVPVGAGCLIPKLQLPAVLPQSAPSRP